MTQVATTPRICIFLVLLVASGAFAKHLHLFEPVLRHHKDPRTGDDELVGPGDPAFEEESEKARELREERREELLGIRLDDKKDKGEKGD